MAFLEHLRANASATSSSNSVLDALQKGAFQRLSELHVPSVNEEEWRFTNLRELNKVDFVPVLPEATDGKVSEAFLSKYRLSDCARQQLVFIDGALATPLSDFDEPEGLTLAKVSDLSANELAELAPHFGKINRFDFDLFATLNEAFFFDGMVLRIDKSVHLEQPIHFLHITTAAAAGKILSPRVYLHADRGAQASIIEEFVSTDEVDYLNVPSVETFLDESAHVVHVKVQQDSREAFHVARVSAHLNRHSHYETYTVSTGAKLSRNDAIAIQREDEINCTLDGLVMITGNQHSDTHTIMDHQKPWGESHQLHKVIVDDHAHSVFNGKIFVRKYAQKTNSFQENRTLLMSPTATVNTKPQLEIFADDVKCSHGATIGQLEDEQLFYLNTRGLSKNEAKMLLLRAFAGQVIYKVPVDAIKPRLLELMEKFTAKDILVEANS